MASSQRAETSRTPPENGNFCPKERCDVISGLCSLLEMPAAVFMSVVGELWPATNPRRSPRRVRDTHALRSWTNTTPQLLETMDSIAGTIVPHEVEAEGANANLGRLPAEILLQICTRTEQYGVPILSTKDILVLSCSCRELRLKLAGLFLLDRLDVVADLSNPLKSLPQSKTTKKENASGNAEIERRLKRVRQLYRRTGISGNDPAQPLSVNSFLCFVTGLILDETNVTPDWLAEVVLPRAYVLKILSLNRCVNVTAVDFAILLETAVEQHQRTSRRRKGSEFQLKALRYLRLMPLPKRSTQSEDRTLLAAVSKIRAAIRTLRDSPNTSNNMDLLLIEPFRCSNGQCRRIASCYGTSSDSAIARLADGRCSECHQDRFCRFCGVFEASEGPQLPGPELLAGKAELEHLVALCAGLGISSQFTSISKLAPTGRPITTLSCARCQSRVSACSPCLSLHDAEIGATCTDCPAWYCMACEKHAAVLPCTKGCGRTFCITIDGSGCHLLVNVIRVKDRQLICEICSQEE